MVWYTIQLPYNNTEYLTTPRVEQYLSVISLSLQWYMAQWRMYMYCLYRQRPIYVPQTVSIVLYHWTTLYSVYFRTRILAFSMMKISLDCVRMCACHRIDCLHFEGRASPKHLLFVTNLPLLFFNRIISLFLWLMLQCWHSLLDLSCIHSWFWLLFDLFLFQLSVLLRFEERY